MKSAKWFLTVSLMALFLSTEISAQLTRQWIARFSGGTKNSQSGAVAMAIDRSGNVLVTGWVTNKSTGIDIATVKYSPDGAELARAVYSAGGASKIEKPKAIAIDSGRSVYIASITNAGANGWDYLTIKYDSLLNQVWAQTYDGPQHGDDQPSAIAVNDSLNVFVTGWSLGAGTGVDYATLKYNSAGSLQWEKRYNNSLAVATDSALAMVLRGNTELYVTGTSYDSTTGFDYFTIRYNPGSGDSVWGARYNGFGSGTDIARSISVRSSSEVYVTGGSQDSTGKFDYLTIRYNSTGGQQWVARYDGIAHGDDQAYSVAYQSSSRVYVTGMSLVSGSFYDAVTVRYNASNGAFGWASSYNGPANDDDMGVSINGGGSPYVLVNSVGAGVGRDYALVQYNGANGDEQSSVRYNGTANGNDVPVAFLESGNVVYVTGTSNKTKGSEWLTIKYVDLDNIKYRTFTQDTFALKANSLKPTAAVPNGGNVRDEAMLKAYPKIEKGYPGAPGGLVVGNARPDSPTLYGWMRFDKGKGVGAYLPDTGAARRFDWYGTAPFVGEKKNPKRDKHNNHLAGELIALRINIGASDAEITPPTFGDLRYDDGDTSNHYNDLTLRQIAAIVDNCLTYGASYPTTNWALFDTILARANRAFTGSLMVVTKSPLVVTGVNPVDSVWYLLPAIAPVLEPLAFDPNWLVEEPESYTLYQNYPNPFNPTTTIEFSLPEPAIVTLKIYDIIGREASTLIDRTEIDEGTHEVAFDASGLASGVYFYRIIINDGEFQQVCKMMLMR